MKRWGFARLRRIVPTLAPGAVATAALCIGAAVPKTEARQQPVTHVVTLQGMRFTPGDLTVRPGERVEWANKDLVPHTATAVDKAFDSKSIAPGASWTFTAVKAGSYVYGCAFHPTMKATLTVR